MTSAVCSVPAYRNIVYIPYNRMEAAVTSVAACSHQHVSCLRRKSPPRPVPERACLRLSLLNYEGRGHVQRVSTKAKFQKKKKGSRELMLKDNCLYKHVATRRQIVPAV